MAERLKARAWRARVPERVPWVRIPLSPPHRDRAVLDERYARLPSYAPIAQLDRASGCGPEGRMFESCWARQIPESPRSLPTEAFSLLGAEKTRGAVWGRPGPPKFRKERSVSASGITCA